MMYLLLGLMAAGALSAAVVLIAEARRRQVAP